MGKLILFSGGVLALSLTAVSQIDTRAQSGAFLGLMAVASLAYVATLVGVSRPPQSRRLLIGCLVAASFWRVAMMSGAPLVSDDVFRYVWDGRVQRFGYNPLTAIPDDPALAHLHTDLTRQIDLSSAELPSIYPPAAQLFFRIVTTLHESVIGMVLATTVCDLLTILLMWRWLVAAGRSPWWVLAYAWHPLVALEGAGGGHIDIVGTTLVVAAGLALSRRRGLVAAIALAGAFAVKFLPVVLVPLLWGRVRIRDALAGLALVALAYLPFLDSTLALPVGSLGVYTDNWRFNGPIFSLLARGVGTVPVLALGTGAGLAVAAWARRRRDVDDPAAWAWPMAVALLAMPAVYPWYLAWLTPFLTVRANWPLVAWTLGSLATYVVWRSELAGTGWILPGWVMPVEYGLVVGVAAWVWRSREPFSQPAAS